jgi:hypothetical protein
MPGSMLLPSKILALLKVSMAFSPPSLIRPDSLRPRIDTLPQNTRTNGTARARVLGGGDCR